jgi:hypothetical protein
VTDRWVITLKHAYAFHTLLLIKIKIKISCLSDFTADRISVVQVVSTTIGHLGPVALLTVVMAFGHVASML